MELEWELNSVNSGTFEESESESANSEEPESHKKSESLNFRKLVSV